jgi:hypothetical protein
MVEQVTKHNITNSWRDAVRQRIASTTSARLPVLMRPLSPRVAKSIQSIVAQEVGDGLRGGGVLAAKPLSGDKRGKFLIP